MSTTATALSLATAARLAGIDKSTLRRAVKAGKLSAARDDNGVWRVEACEVERLYPLAPPDGARPADSPGALPRDAAGDAAPAADAALVAALAELRGLLADMREDRDRWRSMAERLSVAGPKPAPEQPTTWLGRWHRRMVRG